MSRLARALIAATSAATLTSAASFAEPTDRVEIDQSASGAVTATDDQTAGGVEVATQTGLAQANSATGEANVWTALRAGQALDGTVLSANALDADEVWSYAISNATAQGNALTAGANAELESQIRQTTSGGSAVGALSALRIGTYAGHTVQGASAASNAVQTSGYGDQSLVLDQVSDGDTASLASLDASDAEIETVAQGAAAAGNSLTASGFGGSVIADAVQTNSGDVSAETAATVRDAEYGVVSTSGASGNTIRLTADDAYAHAQGSQTNRGAVRATTRLNVGDFGEGLVAGAATATGNASLVSGIGADVYSGVVQDNAGPVTARVDFAGGAIGSGVGGAGAALSASAIGNAQSAYLCSECPVSLTAEVNQTNSGPVSASVTGTSFAPAGALTSSATAVGNAATFQGRRPGE
ncbi:MAG: hypothetical protein ACOC05_09845 [Oceanicaulis sp.]